MSHTPGPWFCTPHDEQPGTFIVKRSEHHYLQTGKDEANARLIAAAPELLAGCKQAVAAIELATAIGAATSEGLAAMHGELCKVIAKAEQP